MYNETVHTEGTTAHAKGTRNEMLQVPTDVEVPSRNTVICTDTKIKKGTH